ncbi:MAG: hypothetical protein HQL62_09685, partial [Magnetococcales bacterium]|nr:hypothetical protein [Magnetococcales bacterium]
PYVNTILTRLTGWRWLTGSMGVVTQGLEMRLWAKDLTLTRGAAEAGFFRSEFATCIVTPLAWMHREPLIQEVRLQDLVVRIPRQEMAPTPRGNQAGNPEKNLDPQKILEELSLVMGIFHAPFPVSRMIFNNVSVRMGGTSTLPETEILQVQDWVMYLGQDKDRTAIELKAAGRIVWNNRLAVIDISGMPDPQGVWQLRSRIHGAGLTLLLPLFPELVKWEPHDIWGNAHIDTRFEPGRGLDMDGSALIHHARGQIPLHIRGQFQENGRWFLNAGVSGLRPGDFRQPLTEFLPLGELTTPLSLKLESNGSNQTPTSVDWRLVSGSGTLTWKPLFRWPFPVTRFLAHGTLNEDKLGRWNLVVKRFDLRNTQGQAAGEFSLSGLGGKKDPVLDLRAEASGVPTEQANFFYPVTIMPPDLVAWLDNSLKKGRVDRAKARIFGPVSQIPFPEEKTARKNGWIFRIEGDVSGADVQFYPGLPPVSGVSTHLVFDRLSMLAVVSDGSLARSSRVHGQVGIPDMLHQPTVIIDASAQANLDSVWQDLIAHPLLRWDEELGLVGMTLDADGPARLKVSLPLDHPQHTQFSGEVELTEAWVKLPFLDSPIQHLSGQLKIDSRQLKLAARSAEMYAIPFQGTLEVSDYKDTILANLLLDVTGRIPAKQVQRSLQPLLVSEGTHTLPDTPFQLSLSHLPEDKRFHFDVRLDAHAWSVVGKPGWVKKETDSGSISSTGYLQPEQQNLVVQHLVGQLGNLNFAGAGALDLHSLAGHLVMNHMHLGETAGNMRLVRNATAKVGHPEWKVEMAWDVMDIRPLLKLMEFPATPPGEEKSTQPAQPWPHLHISGFARRAILAHGESARDMEVGFRLAPEGYTFDRLLFNQDGARQQLEVGEFHWQRTPGPDAYSGRFRITSDNLGSLLKGLDRGIGMQEGQAVFNLELAGNSPSASHSLLRHLSGKGEIHAQKGVVHRLSFLASLLGLFSIPDLPNLL